MKKVLLIFSLLIFVIACKSTPTNTTPEDVVIADDPQAVEQEKPKPEEVVADTNMPSDTQTLASGSEELYLPIDTSIRDTERGRILETTPKVIFKFVETT